MVRDVEFHRDVAAGIGDGQLGDRVRVEAGDGGRQVELAEPEMGAGRIDAHEIVVAFKCYSAAGAAGGVGVGCGNAPGDALGWVQGPPSG